MKTFFSTLENRCPDDDEKDETLKTIRMVNFTNGEELIKLF